MNDWQQGLAQRLAELKESFDRAFALPQARREDGGEKFLIIVVGTQRYAIKIGDLLGLENHRKVVSLPVSVGGLLGLAGLGGQLIPVFSLASLLGQGPPASPPPWIARCKGEPALAIAFDRFEGSAQVANQDVHAAEPVEASQKESHLLRQTVRLGSSMLYVIDVPSVVAAAKQRLAVRG